VVEYVEQILVFRRGVQLEVCMAIVERYVEVVRVTISTTVETTKQLSEAVPVHEVIVDVIVERSGLGLVEGAVVIGAVIAALMSMATTP
jgi:hypothetical protein